VSGTKTPSRRPSRAKTGHVPFSELPVVQRSLTELSPAPENDQLYRPVDPDDPALADLTRSVRAHGVLEALVVTTDGYILSGHRRYAAAKRAGCPTVPCKVAPITRHDPQFLPLLRECNRQRVKSFDEAVREEMVSYDPEESHRLLVEHRRSASAVSAETIDLGPVKRRCRISNAKTPMLDAVLAVLDERKELWPLSARQIHYALLNRPPLRHVSKPYSRYANDKASYKDLTDLLTRARLVGRVPMYAIDDATRPVETWNVWANTNDYVRCSLRFFLKGYYRDLMRSQPNQVEIVVEKNTVNNIVSPVAEEYTIPMTTGRGYASLPPRWEMRERFRESGKEKLVILFLSDLDPEGEDLAQSFARSFRDDFGIDPEKIVPVKVALTPLQVEELGLPRNFRVKEGSSRAAKYRSRHGEHVWELEALSPGQLQQELRKAIDSVLDLDLFNRDVDAEKRDAADLDGLRRQMRTAISIAKLDPHDEDES
jgi:hypothetical protein